MDIAFLGIGLMGKPMAERLIDAGHRLVLFNRTKEKALALEKKGAEIADHPAEAFSRAECVILMLSDYPAIAGVLSGSQESLAGKTVIQMGTILPEESCSLKQDIEKSGGEYFEAPVLGSRDKAQAGELIIMVGSTEAQFGHFQSILKCFGPAPKHIGEVGKAAALKLALNQMIVSLTAAFSLSVGIADRAGVKIDDFMEILRESALYAPTFDKKLPRIVERNFSDPNFPLRHMLKDVDLILKQAQSQGLEVSFLDAVRDMIKRAIDQGWADEDYSALARAIQPEQG